MVNLWIFKKMSFGILRTVPINSITFDSFKISSSLFQEDFKIKNVLIEPKIMETYIELLIKILIYLV